MVAMTRRRINENCWQESGRVSADFARGSMGSSGKRRKGITGSILKG